MLTYGDKPRNVYWGRFFTGGKSYNIHQGSIQLQENFLVKQVITEGLGVV